MRRSPWAPTRATTARARGREAGPFGGFGTARGPGLASGGCAARRDRRGSFRAPGRAGDPIDPSTRSAPGSPSTPGSRSTRVRDRRTWWAERDSNPRRRKPADLQSALVDRLSIRPSVRIQIGIWCPRTRRPKPEEKRDGRDPREPAAWIEHATLGLQNRCSTAELRRRSGDERTAFPPSGSRFADEEKPARPAPDVPARDEAATRTVPSEFTGRGR